MATNWNESYRPERRASWEDISTTIRESVKMDELIPIYAPAYPPRHHRIPCPIHNGRDYNFSFTDKGYKCFVCGESGDQIKFVEKVLNISRQDAMRKINDDLRLNLPIDRFSNSADFGIINERVKVARERELARQLYEAEYKQLMDEWCRLDKISRTADPDSKEYEQAVKRLPEIAYRIDNLEEPR